MAILQGCPGIECTVVSNGNDLEEYPDEDVQFSHPKFFAPLERRSMSYIECTSDAEFGIKWRVMPEYDTHAEHTHLGFWAYVDGQAIGGIVTRVDTGYYWSTVHAEALTRINDAQISSRKLKFCSIDKVDDADSARVKSDAKLADGLGEILVFVHRCTQTGEIIGSSGKGKDVSPVTEISEKALKGRAISHGVGLGPERRLPAPIVYKTEYPDGYGNPVSIFRFKYRSREALQQEMIIPRSPSPEVIMGPLNPRSRNNDNANLTKEQRLAKLKREIEEIKSEDQDKNPRSRKRGLNVSDIQSSGRAYKTSRHSNGSVVVDLTDD